MKTSDIKFKILWKDGWLKDQLENKTIREIAKEVRCSFSAINYVIKKLNIKVPKRIKYKIIVDKSSISKKAYKKKYPNGRFGNLASNWKNGKTIVYCIDCGKRLLRWWNAKRCKSCARRFEYLGTDKSPFYIDGRNTIRSSIRNLNEYKNWRFSIYKRDNFTCQICKQRKDGELEADHIKTFAILLDSFLKKYNKYSPVNNKIRLCKLAQKYQPFWDISNGRTLCKKCHRKTTTYGNRKN